MEEDFHGLRARKASARAPQIKGTRSLQGKRKKERISSGKRAFFERMKEERKKI